MSLMTSKNLQTAPAHWEFNTEFDAKELGCGDLVMALFKFFKSLEKGTVVKVKALDPGDVLAWCRSTGNVMHDSQPPFFLIEKKS